MPRDPPPPPRDPSRDPPRDPPRDPQPDAPRVLPPARPDIPAAAPAAPPRVPSEQPRNRPAAPPVALETSPEEPHAPPNPTALQAEQTLSFDTTQFLLSLGPGDYSVTHTFSEWTLGDLERLDSLLFEQNLGLPNFSRMRAWWRLARPRISARVFNEIVRTRHRRLLESTGRLSSQRSLSVPDEDRVEASEESVSQDTLVQSALQPAAQQRRLDANADERAAA